MRYRYYRCNSTKYTLYLGSRSIIRYIARIKMHLLIMVIVIRTENNNYYYRQFATVRIEYYINWLSWLRYKSWSIVNFYRYCLVMVKLIHQRDISGVKVLLTMPRALPHLPKNKLNNNKKKNFKINTYRLYWFSPIGEL